MKAERPTSITIGPLTWAIDYNAATLALADKMERTDRIGVTSTRELLIRIDGDMPEPHVTETLHHELLHAILYTHGIRVPHEERTVAALSPTLLDTLQRNPALIAYLTV